MSDHGSRGAPWVFEGTGPEEKERILTLLKIQSRLDDLTAVIRGYEAITGKGTYLDVVLSIVQRYGRRHLINYSDPFGLQCIQNGKSVPDDFCPETQGLKDPGLLDPTLLLGGLEAEGGEAVVAGVEAVGKDVAAAAEAGATKVAGTIAGFTKHGINQAVSRDGVGVASGAILDAVRNPVSIVKQAEGVVKYVGQNATVILNEAGEVITTWARNASGWRISP